MTLLANTEQADIFHLADSKQIDEVGVGGRVETPSVTPLTGSVQGDNELRWIHSLS